MKPQIKYRRELYKLFPIVSEAVCVELGVAEGYFSADMLSWGIKKLYSVDLWESKPGFGDISNNQTWHNKNYNDTKERLRKFGERSEILRGPTTAMAQYVKDGECDLVYIDAGHDYQNVWNDLHAWHKKVKRGGVIAGHDYLNPSYGVKSAVGDFCRINGYQVFEIPEDKNDDAGFYFFV